jgi:hypothetical protein
VQWFEAYDAVDKQGRFMVGGLSQGGSVGAAGGWVMGAGHSALSASHGLGMIYFGTSSASSDTHCFLASGVDNVIQFTVVTAKGVFLTVNAYQNADLFWALRGGGGGTYAVVISTTYRTHQKFPLTSVIFFANFTSATTAKSVVTEYVKMHPALADAGWGGYSFLSTDSLGFLYVAPNISLAEANTTIQPFVNFAVNATGAALPQLTPYDSFYSWYAASFPMTGQVGTNVELGSRLLPRDEAVNNAANVADIMLSVQGGVALKYVLSSQICTSHIDSDIMIRRSFVGGGAVSKVDPDAMGLHPDWRKALALVYFDLAWREGDPVSVIQGIKNQIIDGVNILDKLAPGSATYFNEVTSTETSGSYDILITLD